MPNDDREAKVARVIQGRLIERIAAMTPAAFAALSARDVLAMWRDSLRAEREAASLNELARALGYADEDLDAG